MSGGGRTYSRLFRANVQLVRTIWSREESCRLIHPVRGIKVAESKPKWKLDFKLVSELQSSGEMPMRPRPGLELVGMEILAPEERGAC